MHAHSHVHAHAPIQVLELERLRLRDAAAAIERQAHELKRAQAALARERAHASLSFEEQDAVKAEAWAAQKQEEVRSELARVQADGAARLQQDSERMRVELREQLVRSEREDIRRALLGEEKQALAVERLKLRQRIIKEET